jgi:hypothetical protein
VFQEGTKPKYAPKATVDNVLEAVQYGITREYRNALKKASMLNGAGPEAVKA